MFTLMDSVLAFTEKILLEHNCDRTQVIAVLQEIQSKYRYLPEEAVRLAARKMGMSVSDIYGVATFYENFSLEPKGKYVVKCCNGTACHVRKSDDIADAIYKSTGTSPEKNTSDDMLFTVERVSCLGACGLAPVCTVNDEVYAPMTPEKVTELIEKLKKEDKADAD